MGQVYRARDTKLNRDVALKVLPDSLASDAERLARLTREAQTLAALNHPHIAQIYGLEDATPLPGTGRTSSTGSIEGPVRALVMEFVEGEDLSARIARGALALDEAVPIASQIADALDAAHQQGIVHRDLKPANVRIRPDGTVKVLDFGLAKAMGPPGVSAADLTNAPTMVPVGPVTGEGRILGTTAYMSPEQAKGQVVDKRSDIWSFGGVFYEMLTGQRTFRGDDGADTIDRVLTGDPDWLALPAVVPTAVRTLLQECLRKDRRERVADISTALFVLRHPHVADYVQPIGAAPQALLRRALMVAAIAVVGAAAAIALRRADAPPPAAVTRFAFTVPPGQALYVNRRTLAISPDGTRVVFATEAGLFLRSVAELAVRAIPGASPGVAPVFSPDGRSIAFYGDSAIKRIATEGGTAVTLCTLDVTPPSMMWSGDRIVFARPGSGVWRVSATGGNPELLLDLSASENTIYGAQLLPDNDTLLYTSAPFTNVESDGFAFGQVVAHSIKSGQRTVVVEDAGEARYVPTGHLAYVSSGTLFVAPFDAATRSVIGPAVPIVDGLSLGGILGFGSVGQYAFSDSGSLAYVPGPPAGAQDLGLSTRMGAHQSLGLPRGTYEFPRVSPDGSRIAFGTVDGKEAAIAIYGVSGATSARRLTFGGNNRFPIWSPDGRHVAFQSDRDGDLAVFRQPVDGGAAERLTTPESGTAHIPESWSPNGDVLLFSASKDFVTSLWMLSLSDKVARPFGDAAQSSLPTDATFSPDGRWVAYQIARPGMIEASTYVQPFPPDGTRYQVARGGRPMWSRDGQELFFVPGPGRFLAVTVKSTTPSFSVGSPVDVPRNFGLAAPGMPRTFDIMPDGRIVGVVTPGQSAGPAEIRVVLNALEELRR